VQSNTSTSFNLPENSKLGLRDQICEMVSSSITSGALSSDKRLPSCRELAQQLEVSRNTVFAAYNRLIDLGLLVSRNRSGYFIASETQSLLMLNSNNGLGVEPEKIEAHRQFSLDHRVLYLFSIH